MQRSACSSGAVKECNAGSRQRVGLGTAALGHLFHAVDDETAITTIETAWEAGIRFFDTAHLYGGGLSEQRLGMALRRYPRGEYRLATKIGCYRPFGQGPIPPGGTARRSADVWDYGYDRTLAAVETSLKRLGVARLDIVHIHGFDDHIDEALSGARQALARLKREGVIGRIGGACDAVVPLVEGLSRDCLDVVVCAGRCTLLDRTAQAGLLDLAAKKQAGFIAAGLFNSGILATGAVEEARFDYAAASPGIVDRVRKLETLCARHDVDLRSAALQFPLRDRRVEMVLLGPANVAELQDSLARFDDPIPRAFWLESDKLAESEGSPA